jgi:hypothetical protein
MIGSLGTLIFMVSSSQFLTFHNFKREVSATWNTVERIGAKPLPQFGGAKLQSLSLVITLDAQLGVKPREMIEKIEKMIEAGEANPLIIGKNIVGSHEWIITKSSESWDYLLNKGELIKATVTINLQEYL